MVFELRISPEMVEAIEEVTVVTLASSLRFRMKT